MRVVVFLRDDHNILERHTNRQTYMFLIGVMQAPHMHSLTPNQESIYQHLVCLVLCELHVSLFGCLVRAWKDGWNSVGWSGCVTSTLSVTSGLSVERAPSDRSFLLTDPFRLPTRLVSSLFRAVFFW